MRHIAAVVARHADKERMLWKCLRHSDVSFKNMLSGAVVYKETTGQLFIEGSVYHVIVLENENDVHQLCGLRLNGILALETVPAAFLKQLQAWVRFPE